MFRDQKVCRYCSRFIESCVQYLLFSRFCFFVFTWKVVIAGDKLFPSINTRNVDLDEFRALTFVLL